MCDVEKQWKKQIKTMNKRIMRIIIIIVVEYLQY